MERPDSQPLLTRRRLLGAGALTAFAGVSYAIHRLLNDDEMHPPDAFEGSSYEPLHTFEHAKTEEDEDADMLRRAFHVPMPKDREQPFVRSMLERRKNDLFVHIDHLHFRLLETIQGEWVAGGISSIVYQRKPDAIQISGTLMKRAIEAQVTRKRYEQAVRDLFESKDPFPVVAVLASVNELGPLPLRGTIRFERLDGGGGELA